MFIIANLLTALAQITDLVLNLVLFLIFIRAIISWVNPDPYNPIVQFLYKTTEPVLEPIRRFLPLGFRFGIDISPIVAFLLIRFLQLFFVRTLFSIALRMQY